MASLEETLKKLNKNKKEEDKVNVVGDREVVRTRTSTGSPYIDYLCGGFMNGGYNAIFAKGGTGKSSISLLACKDTIERRKKVAVYFDGESTLDDSYFTRMGIDKHNFIHMKGRNLEEMLDSAEAFAQSEDVGIIIMDSIPIFVATSVEAKSAEDNHIGTEAKKYTTRMPIIEGYASKRDIAIVGLSHYKKDPGVMMGDNRVTPRGEWQGTMMNTYLDLTKKKIIYNQDGEIIGHTLDIRIKKSKGAPYDATKVYTTNFYNEGGFDILEEYSRLFIETEFVRSSGAWIYFPDENGEEQKANGKDAFMEHLKKNKETFDFLKNTFINA